MAFPVTVRGRADMAQSVVVTLVVSSRRFPVDTAAMDLLKLESSLGLAKLVVINLTPVGGRVSSDVDFIRTMVPSLLANVSAELSPFQAVSCIGRGAEASSEFSANVKDGCWLALTGGEMATCVASL